MAGLFIVPVAALLLLLYRSAARLAHVREEVNAELGRRVARGFDREPILDPGIPGDIAESYDEASHRVAGLPEPLLAAARKTFFFRQPVSMPSDEELLKIEGPLGGVVEAVRAGLGRSHFRFDLDYRPGLSRWKDRASGQSLESSLYLETERARAQGRDADALRAWISLLGFAGDDLRGLDAYWALHRPNCLLYAALTLDRLLARHRLPPDDLRDALRALERVEASWPSLEEAGRIHFLLCRISVVSGDDGSLSAPEPGWRYLWSRDCLDLAMLAALDREERAYTGLFALPPGERAPVAKRLDDEYTGTELARGRNWHGFGLYIDEDLHRRSLFGLLKTALALAWHEAETGRPPERLEDLVPGRIAALPVCARTGKPFGYAPGRVWWEGYDNKDDGGKPLPADFSTSDGDVVIRIGQR